MVILSSTLSRSRGQAEVVVIVDVERELVCHVSEADVVGRGREQQCLAVEGVDVFLDCFVVPAFVVAQGVGFVDYDECVAPQAR